MTSKLEIKGRGSKGLSKHQYLASESSRVIRKYSPPTSNWYQEGLAPSTPCIQDNVEYLSKPNFLDSILETDLVWTWKVHIADSAIIFRLEIWPGFATSILQYETRVMLCADVAHKVLRTETVMDVLETLYRANRATFREVAVKKLVGSIVMTR